MLKASDHPWRETPVAMSASLRQKLRAIPRLASQVGCEDVERLYQAARQHAWNDKVDPGVVAHLEICPPCQTLYSTLDAAFRQSRRPVSRGLKRRLRRIVSATAPPSLLARDSRLAVAASILLTASLMLLVGDASALVRGTAETVVSRATVLAEVGEERGQALWEELASDVAARYTRSRELLTDHGPSYEELKYEARKLYEPENWRQLVKSLTLQEIVEGDSDGKP